MKIFATKIGTTHIYSDNNKHQVVTVLRLEKTVVGKIKNENKDGYNACVLIKSNDKAKPSKTLAGQFKGMPVAKVLEDKTSALDKKIGDEYTIKDLKVGDLISVSGKTKGKGFQGTVKRHGFNTGPKTHGSRNYRRPGSIGMTTPSRVTLGKPMAGHMGFDTKTQKKVKIERIDEANNTVWVRGHIIGPSKAGLVIIK